MTDLFTDSDKAYLLRCWQDRPAAGERPAVWRFSIQRTMSQDPPQGLASLAALLSILQADLSTSPPSPPPEERTDPDSYRSWTIRAWRAREIGMAQPLRWRLEVQDELHIERRQAFDSFERLVAFLRDELG